MEPNQPTDPQPDPVKEALDAARRAAEEARANASAWRQQAEAAMARMTSNLAVREETEPAEEPDEDVDPAVLKALEKRLSKHLGKFSKELEQVYVRDRQQDMERWTALEIQRAASTLPKYRELQSDIETYLNSVPPHLRATPGAVETAYHVALGKRTHQELAQQAERGAQLSATGARSSSPAPSSSISPDDRAALQRMFGEDFSDDELDALSNRVLSYEDYKKRATK